MVIKVTNGFVKVINWALKFTSRAVKATNGAVSMLTQNMSKSTHLHKGNLHNSATVCVTRKMSIYF